MQQENSPGRTGPETLKDCNIKGKEDLRAEMEWMDMKTSEVKKKGKEKVEALQKQSKLRTRFSSVSLSPKL